MQCRDSEPEGVVRGNALHVFECKRNDLGMQIAKRASYCGKNLVLSYIVSFRQHPVASLDALFCRNADGQPNQKESTYGIGKVSWVEIVICPSGYLKATNEFQSPKLST